MTDIQSRSIYIEGFPLTTSEVTLKKLFSNFGHIKRIDIPTFESQHPICRGLAKPKTKGYATIEYTTQEASKKAVDFFNDLDYIMRMSKMKKSQATEIALEIGDDQSLRSKIVQNLEFKNLLLLRVMPSKVYSDLCQNYNEQKFNSLIRAARSLLIAK